MAEFAWKPDGTIARGPNKGKARERDEKSGRTRVAKEQPKEEATQAPVDLSSGANLADPLERRMLADRHEERNAPGDAQQAALHRQAARSIDVRKTLADSVGELRLYQEFQNGGSLPVPRLWREASRRDPQLSRDEFAQEIHALRKSKDIGSVVLGPIDRAKDGHLSVPTTDHPDLYVHEINVRPGGVLDPDDQVGQRDEADRANVRRQTAIMEAATKASRLVRSSGEAVSGIFHRLITGGYQATSQIAGDVLPALAGVAEANEVLSPKERLPDVVGVIARDAGISEDDLAMARGRLRLDEGRPTTPEAVVEAMGYEMRRRAQQKWRIERENRED